MELPAYFRMLARYNRVANERLYAACGRLDENEFREARKGSFGSIRGVLNHLLLGDRIWMARFEADGTATPKLDTILYSDFADLRQARAQEDIRIEQFFDALSGAYLSRSLSYVNSRGEARTETAPLAIGHFFNHQTHHRAQVHVMLSQTAIPPPSLDLHAIINA